MSITSNNPNSSRGQWGRWSTSSFPRDLGAHFMTFDFKEYNRKAPDDIGTTVGGDIIALPIPAGLTDNTGIKYNAGVELGIFGSAANLVDRIAAGGSLTEELVNTDMASVAGQIIARKASDINASLGVLVDQVKGNILNPNLTVAFEGVDLRSYTFQWKFIPTNEFESRKLAEIISRFKFNALPAKQSNGLFLKYPNICYIDFWGTEEGLLFKLKKSSLTNITVNYGAAGFPTFFAKTGAPTEVDISLSFQELEAQTQEDAPIQRAGGYAVEPDTF